MKQGHIELYDVGRTVTGPFKAGYAFIAEGADKYIDDKAALGRIKAFHRDRSLGISQEDFNHLNAAWVAAIKNGELQVDPERLVYKDVKPRFDKVRTKGEVWLLTSGSVELTDLLIGGQAEYNNVIVGEKIGDKNDPKTYRDIWNCTELTYLEMWNTKNNIRALFEDKPSCLLAAHEGFGEATRQFGDPNKAPQLYFVDRDGIVPQDKIKEMESKGIIRIESFYDVD